jgi:hypothetical protein
MSVSIQELDLTIEIKIPKVNELEVKFYNPHFFESLGYSNTSISVIDASINIIRGGDSHPDNGNDKLTFPFNQFVYLLRGRKPYTPTTSIPTPIVDPDLETKPGLYGVFSNTLDKISGVFSRKKDDSLPKIDETETIAKEVEEPTTTSTEPSSISTLFSTTREEISNLPKSVVVSPTVVTEPKYDVVTDTQVVETKSQDPMEQQSISEMAKSILPITQPTEPITSTAPPINETNVQLPSIETPIIEQTLPIIPKVTEIQNIEKIELPPNEVETEVSNNVTEPIQPVVLSSTPLSIPHTITQYWKISIPKVPYKEVFDEIEVLEKSEKQLRDIIWFSKMEMKSGIYVNGTFYTILGKHIKLGTVEPASEEKNSVRDYLQTISIVEGTLMDKYHKLYM